MNEEKVLKIEAQEAVKEISFAVDYVEISKVLEQTVDCVYMNLKTKEGDCFCVELTVQGFRVKA